MTTSYHHGNLREELVRQAVALAREKGEDGVVLREVARRAGVSHNAAYRHFSDREELLALVAQAGMQELAAAMRLRLARKFGGSAEVRARRRLREIGTAYVEFALAEPGLFGVAFAAPIAGHPAQVEPVVAEGGPYELLGECLDGLVAAGVLPPERRENAEILCWAAVHGFAMLHLHGPLAAVPPEVREASLEQMLDRIERGLA
jgi:AcrR family transcriptional regulator